MIPPCSTYIGSDHYAAGIYLGTYDWPNRNCGMWRNMGEPVDGNPYSDGKWRFMSFDYDFTMGKTYGDYGGVEGYTYDKFRHMDNGKKYAPTNLFINLLKNNDFRSRFVNVYCDYANEVLSPEKANATLEVYSREYTEPLAQTTVRWWGFYGGSKESNLIHNRQQYTSKTIPQIRTFFRERAKYTLEDMQDYLGLTKSMQTITLKSAGGGRIRINSITPDVSNGWSGEYPLDCPVTLTALPDNGAEFTGWSGSISSNEQTITVELSEAMTITANFTESKLVRGDVNSDGSFGAADLVTMQKWLLGDRSSELADWEAGDLDGDGRLDTFDLVAMRKEILK